MNVLTVCDVSGIDLYFPREYLKAALVVSLLSVWVLVGLFYYLNRYTKRRYFSQWTVAWLFYALWLTMNLRQPEKLTPPFPSMLNHWCVGIAAVFLLWGSATFLAQRARQTLIGLFMTFLFTWSYVGAYHLENELFFQVPIFALIGAASLLTSWCFYRFRTARQFLGAGLLSCGFLMWGLYLMAYPFIQISDAMISSGFFISAVLQLFIAVSMIILVLEEVRNTNLTVFQRMDTYKSETELLRARMASTEERYRSLFDQASEGIIITTADDVRILELNQTARRLLGFLPNDQIHIPLSSFCRLNDPVSDSELTGLTWFTEICHRHHVQIVRKDGSLIPVDVYGAPIQFENQSAYQFFFREITERARLEQQLRQAEKLSALGQMISGIAHELNNPLAVIKGYLELILKRHELNKQTRADLEKVARESNRAAKLVNNFLSFAREQPAQREPVNLNELIQRVVEVRKFDLRVSGTELAVSLDPQLPETHADPDQLQQVLVNLVSNALQAIVELDRPGRLRIVTQREDSLIIIQVEDNGPGIPENLQAHIFEPFFTTKEVGTGTGLGLSIAHSIMTDHDGRIEYYDVVGGGAGFRLELPIVHGQAYPMPAALTNDSDGANGAAVPSAQILVLDDERSLAELLGEMLEILGHHVTLCTSAPHALELLDYQKFDLIISDFRMPQMDGRQFYELACRKESLLAQRIVFITGDVVSEETQSFLKAVGNPHLSKPFQLDSVEQVVAKVLHETASLRALD